MERRPRMPSRLAGDNPALFHQRLAGKQSALPVLVVDEREPALVTSDRSVAPPRREVVDNAAERVGIGAARHGSGGARIQIRHQRDRLLAIPRARDGIAAETDRLAKLARSTWHLDLEIGDVLDLPRHACEEWS